MKIVMNAAHQPARIDVKVRELAQLFNSLDPAPFLDRDLDQDAEEFIVSSARELPAAHGFELVIHVANAPEAERAAEVQDAVRHYFASRIGMKRRELRLLLRQGHVSLAIGLVFLSVCLIAGGFAARLGPGSVASIVREGFVIAGWVAMWRPLQTYLYDWWPLRQEGRILQKLARVRVRIMAAAPKPVPAAGVAA